MNSQLKKLLILGGTRFIGRILLHRLQELGGYDITLFNRQQTHADLFPELQKIKGDRESTDVERLSEQSWDYVVDLSCFFPASLSNVLENLQGMKKYILISSCSVYDNEHVKTVLRNEQAPILPCDQAQAVDRSPATYGNRKAECERTLQWSGLDHVILRPALVYGRYDHTDRFYYWLYHVKFKNRLVLPNNGTQTFSITYVDDLVNSIVKALDSDSSAGAYNVISVPQISILKIVELAEEMLHAKPRILNVSTAQLAENNISQWTDMPLWLDYDHFTFDNSRSRDQFNLELSDVRSSVKSTIAYYDTLNWPKPRYGMTEQQRQMLIGIAAKETTN